MKVTSRVFGCLAAALLAIGVVPSDVQAARAVTVVSDPANAAHWAEELAKTIEQIDKLQQQINHMKATVEHLDFRDIGHGVNSLRNILGEMGQFDQEMADLSHDFDSVWNGISSASRAGSVLTATGYGGGQIDLSAAAQATMSENRLRAVENSAKHSAKVASLFNAQNRQETLNNLTELLSTFDGKSGASEVNPVKVAQVVSGILAQQVTETKNMQMLIAEQVKAQAIKAQNEADKERLRQAEAIKDGEDAQETLNKLSKAAEKHTRNVAYSKTPTTYEEAIAAAKRLGN